MENIIDERVKEDVIADYFTYVNPRYLGAKNSYSHLLHIDLKELDVAIPSACYNKLVTCISEVCEFKE